MNNEDGISSSSAAHYEFVVMGSTGNIYTVSIGNLVQCSCPDHAKGNLCKHIPNIMFMHKEDLSKQLLSVISYTYEKCDCY